MKKTEIKKNFLILKILLIVCMAVLIAKFLIVTIYYNGGFEAMAKFQTKIVISNPMPRGEIFDRKSKLIAGNKQAKNLIYINVNSKSDEEEWELVQNLAQNIDVKPPLTKLSKVDYEDLIIRENSEEMYSRLSTEEQLLSQKEVDEKLRNKVTKTDYDELVKMYGLEAVDLKIRIDNSSSTTPQVLATNLSVEEQYYIQNNIGKIGGCFIINSWERIHPYGDTLKGMLGSVGEIPSEELNKYESLGYSSNDLVGTGYIEKELESILKSQSEKIEIYFDDSGNINNYRVIQEGKEGKDVKLTIDIELQKKVDKILKTALKNDSYKNFHTAFSSIVDPDTGELLAVSGIYEDDKKYYDNSIGQFTTAYEIGSVIKPAILGLGYDTGTWEWNKTITDAPIDFGGGTIKSSYHDYGQVDEYQAIKVSSNIYFYDILLNLAGLDYTGNSGFPQEVDQKYFDMVRKELQSYGLGVSTGIDFANEITGVVSSQRGVGLYADIANGQYDTYTPLALTQYMSVLANGKYRMKMNYVYSINSPGEIGKIGNEQMRVSPEILNQTPVGDKDMAHIQDTLAGPSQVGGTTNAAFDSRYQIGSKSGTSESFYFEQGMKEAIKTDNSSFIAYAPYNDPEMAVSVIFPYWTPDGEVSKYSATDAGGEILDACYDLGYIK